MRTQARFPERAARQAGHYESFYLKASAPGGGRSIWLRHTTHQRPGEPVQGSLWLTAFDAGAPGPAARPRRRCPRPRSRRPTAPTSRSATRCSSPDAREGLDRPATPRTRRGTSRSRATPSRSATSRTSACTRSKLPRTKMLSPHPYALFSGPGRDRRRDDRARRLARDGRAQLGRRARRALDLDPGVRPRRTPGRLPRHRGRPDQAGPG